GISPKGSNRAALSRATRRRTRAGCHNYRAGSWCNGDVSTVEGTSTGVKCCRMVDSVVVLTLLAVLAGVFLLFQRESRAESLGAARVVAIATYFVATFLGTYGSVSLATLLVLPILL